MRFFWRKALATVSPDVWPGSPTMGAIRAARAVGRPESSRSAITGHRKADRLFLDAQGMDSSNRS
ncbi:MAG TPA: hypothetical protein VF933_39365 [Streptosporangiaceae bacterium]